MMGSIDKAGRIVIPRAIRDELDLRPDVPLAIDIEGASIRIRPTDTAERHLAFTEDGQPHFPPVGDIVITDLDVQRLRDSHAR